MNFKQLNIGRKIVLIATVVGFISLFLPWVEIGFLNASGFQQQAYIFLIAWIYPIYCVFKNKPIRKVGGYACGILAILLSIMYMTTKTSVIFGETINVSGSGAYVFFIAAIAFTVGIYFDQKQAKR